MRVLAEVEWIYEELRDEVHTSLVSLGKDDSIIEELDDQIVYYHDEDSLEVGDIIGCDIEIQSIIKVFIYEGGNSDSVVLKQHITDGGAIYWHDNKLQDAKLIIRLDGGMEVLRCNLRGKE